MTQVPVPSGKEMLRFLQKQGFKIIRVRGSHHRLEKDRYRTEVPIHGNRSLKIKTFRGILRDVDMSIQEFLELW